MPCFLTCPPYSCSKQWRWIGCSCSGWGPLGLRLQLGGLVCLFWYAAAVGFGWVGWVGGLQRGDTLLCVYPTINQPR